MQLSHTCTCKMIKMLLITTYKMSHTPKHIFLKCLLYSFTRGTYQHGERGEGAQLLHFFFYQKEPSYLSIKNALVFKRYDYLHSLSDRSTFDNDATCQYHEVPSFI